MPDFHKVIDVPYKDPEKRRAVSAESNRRRRISLQFRGLCTRCGKRDVGVSTMAGRHRNLEPRQSVVCDKCKLRMREYASSRLHTS